MASLVAGAGSLLNLQRKILHVINLSFSLFSPGRRAARAIDHLVFAPVSSAVGPLPPELQGAGQ
jgi:hypothetical protein